MSAAQWILANGESLQVSLFFGLLLALAAIEPFVPRRPGPMDRGARWPTNLLFTLLNVLALGVLPVSIVSTAFWAEQHKWGLLNQVVLPTVVLVGVTLVVRGFISFFTHYLMHMVPVFWRLTACITLIPSSMSPQRCGSTPWSSSSRRCQRCPSSSHSV